MKKQFPKKLKETIQIFLKHVIEMLNTEMENRILQLVYTPLLTLEEEEDKLRLELCRAMRRPCKRS